MNHLVSLHKLNPHVLISSFRRFPKISNTCNRSLAWPRVTTQSRRSLQSSNNHFQMPKTPDLIYMPHVMRWMKSKLRFRYLKKIWDPEFSEGAFIYGSTQAVCRITEIIKSGATERLNGLMTVSAKSKLEDDINHRLSQTQRNLIILKPDDIKILIPMAVTFNQEGPGRVCRVGLRILALKWHDSGADNYRLVLVALQTEFSRDYGQHAVPDWIISAFSILECSMLTEVTATR